MANRYENIVERLNSQKRKFLATTTYPTIPEEINDIYVITDETDRLDILATQYYKDPSLWWIISMSNKDLPQDSLFITPGTQIRIPSNLTKVYELFNNINS